MEKYIRTKDRIYKTRQCYPEETLFENVTYVYRHEFVKNKDIIAKADTIEELCDEFIVVHENGHHVIQKKVGNGLKDMDKDYPKYLERNNQVFYGAIWTDKGLIYVAKMNDKGELELL